MNDPHNTERNILAEVEQPGAGKLRLPKAPFRFSEAAVEVRGRAPLMGEDNEWVLAEILQYPKERIEQLTRMGVLFSQPQSEQSRA